MLYKQSFDHDSLDPLSFDPLTFLFEYCSAFCQYRTPSTLFFARVSGMYEEEPSRGGPVTCYDLAPIVNRGSLAALQSAYAGLDPDTFPEDITTAIATGRLTALPDGAVFMQQDLEFRRAHTGLRHQQTLCDPSEYLSLQDMFGNANLQAGPLLDSSGRYRSQINSLVVPAAMRGDSLVDAKFMSRSLLKFVYVTSSHDSAVPPGLHRLLDLPVFRDTQCAQVPDQQCSYVASTPIVLNPGANDGRWERATAVPGKAALLHTRIEDDLRAHIGIPCGDGVSPRPAFCGARKPYDGVAGCYGEDLTLVDAPKQFPSRSFWDRMKVAPPRPPPNPSTPPPCPPSP